MSTHKKDGYVSFSPRIKREIVARDKTCKYPGCEETTKLDVHHIDGDKANHSRDNLISLCHPHHTSIEKSGQAKTLIPYFKSLLNTSPSKRKENSKPVLRDEKGRIVAGSAALNPAGRPAEGESWAGMLKWANNLTGYQAAEISPPEMADAFRRLGNLKIKEAISLRVNAALLFDPTAGLFNAVMDRAEGKLPQPIETWRDKVIDGLRKGVLSPDDVLKEFDSDLATELFIAAGIPVSEG